MWGSSIYKKKESLKQKIVLIFFDKKMTNKIILILRSLGSYFT
jgi:hypothetical protein